MKFWLLTPSQNQVRKLATLEDYFEEEEGGGGGAITNTGQRNQPICSAVCVLLATKERSQCISVPDVTWACAWCLVSWYITQN